jgi:hypothetical protein
VDTFTRIIGSRAHTFTQIHYRFCLLTSQVQAPRTLKEESTPAWLEDDGDENINVNTFPMTPLAQHHFMILHGSEHLRNYQKPSATKQQYEHPIVALSKDSYRSHNKNMIKTFCARCGTHLVWKSPQDVTRQVYINLNCLQSDWVRMPREVASKAIVARRSSRGKDDASPPRSPQTTSRPVSVQVSTTSAVSVITTKPTPAAQTEPLSFSDRASSSETLPTLSKIRQREYVPETPMVSDDEASWTKVDVKKRTDSLEDTASTISCSSASAGGWRLRDPSPSNRSTTSMTSTWEERRTEKPSHDALLYQMRKHLSNHSQSSLVVEDDSSASTPKRENAGDNVSADISSDSTPTSYSYRGGNAFALNDDSPSALMPASFN